MLKFFLDKFKESPGPLKQARLVIGDILEELVDLIEHYLSRKDSDTGETEQAVESTAEDSAAASKERKAPAPPLQSAKKKPQRTPEIPPRELEVPPKLAQAMEISANQKKQEFKVLAILWDAHVRGMKDLSAKGVSDHGTKMGLVIRHENVRKVIRMQLSGFVEFVQNRKTGASIYHYRITPKGVSHFEEKYLMPLQVHGDG